MAFEIKQNDRRPRWRVQLTANGDPVDLTGNAAVRFTMKQGGTTVVNKQAMNVIDASTGVVEYAWGASDTSTVGDFDVEVEVDWGGAPAEYQTFPSTGYFAVKINPELA